MSHLKSPEDHPAHTLWFTRCPVPTATGLAYNLGWLSEAFTKQGVALKTLQESAEALSRHHYDHELDTLIREGGNLLAIAAKAQGAPTRLVGLTWIDEWQTILVRPDSDIRSPADLKGKRLALPSWVDHPIPSHQRGSSIARGMSLHGYKGALNAAGLSLDDVTLVEVPANRGRRREAGEARGPQGLWSGLEFLKQGLVDAVYVKGASAVEAAKSAGAVVGIDLDSLASKRHRVNNGTPRPITVNEFLLEHHFDWVVLFLEQTLRAADWAAHNLAGVRDILQKETWSGADGVATAYRGDFHKSLHPTLDTERLSLFRTQKDFMLTHGFLDRDFDFDAWVDTRPLEDARRRLESDARSQTRSAAKSEAAHA